MRCFIRLAAILLSAASFAATNTSSPKVIAPPRSTAIVREIRYSGTLSDSEARFVAELDVEVNGKGETVVPLFDGNVAVLTTKLPDGFALERKGAAYTLLVAREGRHKLKLDLLAKIIRAEPWNQIAFNGPAAAIASVTAQAAGDGVEVQLHKGVVADSGPSRVTGFLGAEQSVALRWQSKVAEIARKAVLTCDSGVTVQITPTVIKYATALRYEILQGSVTRLQFSLPPNQALTKLQGDNIRDWQIKNQTLSLEFVRPVEKNYTLRLFSEQTIESASAGVHIVPPQPLEVERETGSLTLSAEDVLVEIEKADGLRRVNAAAQDIAAYQFHARPIRLTLKLRRIEPVITVADRVTVRLEEARLLVTHALSLAIEKAGLYTLELVPQPGFVVADVRGEGVEDWKSSGGKLTVAFASRALGRRVLEVQLEQALKSVPEQFTVAPLRVSAAARETAQLGAAAVAGIQIKTATDGLVGLREIPISALPNRTDESLAYHAEQTDWKLTLTAERLAARITADIFNLITVGDGLVGGSATLRYAILNQGVQEFRVKLPALWKNIEFTGPNIRRKEQQGDVWVIGLQEKAWGGYTLVVTYDMAFDPHKAALPVGGIHCVGVERESGSIAITSAANLQIAEGKKTAGIEAAAPAPGNAPGAVVAPTATLRRVDESELAAHDRALITRPVLLAYQYTGDAYEIIAEVTRFDELPVLEAVADRTQLTTVVTEDGQTLTQASFLVKNNDKQFQSFTLPAGAEFWSCYVRGEPAKPERSGERLLVPLPRGANRDEAFAVDIVYKKSVGSLKTLWRDIELSAPVTDMQTTYAEWELYVPSTTRLAGFGGNMIAARGTTYGLRDAWREAVRFYDEFLREYFGALVALAVLFMLVFLMAAAFRRGWRSALAVVGVVAVFVLLSAMLLPALMRVKHASLESERIAAATVLTTETLQRKEENAVVLDKGTDGTVRKDTAGEKLEELKVQVPKPSLVGTPMPIRGVPNLEAPGAPGDLRTRAAREGVVVLGQGAAAGGAGGGLGAERETAATRALGLTEAGGVVSVAGLRPIRIEIPKTGMRFVFTKVLNARSEPLSVSAVALDNDVFKVARGISQALVFVAGLALLWWQWRTSNRRSFLIAFGLALALGGVGAWLLSARLLDTALILLAPMIGLVVLGWLTRKAWRAIPAKNKESAPSAPVPPAVTAALALAVLGAAQATAAPMEKATIVSASYTGVVTEAGVSGETRGVAQFEAALELSTTETNQTVRLFGEDVAVQEFSGPKGEVKRGWFSWLGRKETVGARLVRDGRSVSVWLPEKGSATVRLRFLVNVGGDVTKRKLEFGIPPALVSRLSVTLAEPQAVVELPSAVSFATKTEGQKTRVEAVIGPGEKVDLSWTPRTKREAEIAATVFCQNTSLVTFGSGVVNARAVLDYQVTQGELRQMRVLVPAAHRLMRVEGEGIRTWKLEGNTISVELVKGVSPSYRLTVETEKPMDTPPATVKVEVPHAVDVKRETGLVGLWAGDELSATADVANELQKVDVQEFTDALKAIEMTKPVLFAPRTGRFDVVVKQVHSAYRFLKPGFELQARVEAVQPQVEATVRHQIRVGTEQINQSAMIEYTIKRTGVFTLRLALPPQCRVERAIGTNIAQQVEKDGLLEVTLKQRTMGPYTLQVYLRQTLPELPRKLELTGLQPLDAQKVTGFVLANSEEGVQLRSESFDGLTEVPAAMVTNWAGRGGNALAFKLLPPETGPSAWKLTVSTERVDSWVRAEVANWVTVTETLLSGRSLIRYDIQNAPTKEFRLKVPTQWRNVEISGANIRRKDQQNGQWRLELQNKVRGAYLLTVTWECPWNVKEGILDLPGVETLDVERETGTIAVLAPPPLKVEPKGMSVELLKIDRRELPDWAGATEQAPTLVYRYLRPGYKLVLAAQRFEEAEVLQALVDRMNLTTVISEDGQMMTEMSLAIRNNARQYLEITLPVNATNVWSAFVAGQPVRPSVHKGRLLVPLERTGADGAPIAVELTYIAEGRFPRTRGTVTLQSPALDVPFKNARWDLYLPPDYNYSRFEGTMKRDLLSAVRVAAKPAVELFSLGDYTVAEQRNKAARDAELQSSISNVKEQLKSGKLNEAAQNWNRYRGNVNLDDLRANEELRKVEKDVRRAQGQQLLEAQQQFISANTVYLQSDRQSQAANQPMARPQAAQAWFQFDAEAAEQQAEKVAKAQEITVARTLPLRVNLPKRGIHLTFTQTLQTEVRKPMTLQFLAVESKGLGLMGSVSLALVGFGALWFLAAIVVRRRNM